MKEPLRAYMPALDEVPQHPVVTHVIFPEKKAHGARLGPWKRESWWAYHRKLRVGTYSEMTARIYLNGGGSDHELRFHVWDRTRTSMPCYVCAGCGRIPFRNPPPGFAPAFAIPGWVEARPDADGMEPCWKCNGRGKVEAMYGAANSFKHAPGLEGVFPFKYQTGLVFGDRLHERGLPHPSKEDVLTVMRWADGMLATFYPVIP